MEIHSFTAGMQAQFQFRQEQRCIISRGDSKIAVVHLTLNKTLFSCLDINFKHANIFFQMCAKPQYRQTICANKSPSRALAELKHSIFQSIYIYISSAALSTIETSLVVRLQFCAIACARKKKFAQCEILLDVALETQEVGL